MSWVPPPDPAGLPAPFWVLSTLMTVTQSIHAIFMNFVLGGSWFLLWLSWGRNVAWKRSLYDRCLGVMPVAISLAITFGVAPLLFVQTLYGQFFYTANVLMGAFWLSILLLLVTAFYGVYGLKARTLSKSEDRFAHPAVRTALHFSIALAFTLIAFLFTANASLTVSPGIWEEAFLGSTIATVVREVPFFWPRFLHYLFGAIGIAGLWVVWIANYGGGEQAEPGARAGAVMAAVATLFQMLIGVWYLLALPGGVLQDMFSFQTLGSTHLITGLFLAFFLFFSKAFLVVMPTLRPLRWIATVIGVLVVLTMVTVSEGLRRLLLAEYPSITGVEGHTQTGPMAIFFLLFLAGLAVLAWIARVVTSPPNLEERGPQNAHTRKSPGG